MFLPAHLCEAQKSVCVRGEQVWSWAAKGRFAHHSGGGFWEGMEAWPSLGRRSRPSAAYWVGLTSAFCLFLQDCQEPVAPGQGPPGCAGRHSS